jgi:hypothetical protein
MIAPFFPSEEKGNPCVIIRENGQRCGTSGFTSQRGKTKQQQNVGWGQPVVINIHARSGSQSATRGRRYPNNCPAISPLKGEARNWSELISMSYITTWPPFDVANKKRPQSVKWCRHPAQI